MLPKKSGIWWITTIRLSASQQELILQSMDVGAGQSTSFVFRADNRLLLCKRPESRRAYPGLWTSSAGGHVECNEGYAAAAARELREELGIDCLLTDIGRFNVDR